MRRAVRAAVALPLAFLAALVVLAVGSVAMLAGSDVPAGLAAWGVAALLVEHGSTATLTAALRSLWVAGLAFGLAPVAVTALVGEAARLHGPLWSGLSTGLVTAAAPTLLRATLHLPAAPDGARASALLFLAGAAAGLVYAAVVGPSCVPDENG